jgi:hypothetical protein
VTEKEMDRVTNGKLIEARLERGVNSVGPFRCRRFVARQGACPGSRRARNHSRSLAGGVGRVARERVRLVQEMSHLSTEQHADCLP